MCIESPVAQRFYDDARAALGGRRRWSPRRSTPRRRGGVYFLGIIGDQAHAVRRSGHNCGSMAEAWNYNYGAYDGVHVLAVDVGVGVDQALGRAVLAAALADPRCIYAIYQGVGYRPAWRGGGTFQSSGHPTHVHVSFAARATHDVRPFRFTGSPTVGEPFLSIGGFTVSDMTKDELARWHQDDRKFVEATVERLVDERIDKLQRDLDGKLDRKLGRLADSIVDRLTVPQIEGAKVEQVEWRELATVNDDGKVVEVDDGIVARVTGQQVEVEVDDELRPSTIADRAQP